MSIIQPYVQIKLLFFVNLSHIECGLLGNGDNDVKLGMYWFHASGILNCLNEGTLMNNEVFKKGIELQLFIEYSCSD